MKPNWCELFRVVRCVCARAAAALALACLAQPRSHAAMPAAEPLTNARTLIAVQRVDIAAAEPVRQLDPGQSLDQYYDQHPREFLMVAVPDPRIPRHRRAYEYSIDALIAGMADSDFVLDRYYAPWQDYADAKSNAAPGVLLDCHRVEPVAGGASDVARASTNAAASDAAALAQAARAARSSPCFGMLVFRRDNWRGAAAEGKPALTLRLVYLLPEAATYGVPAGAVIGALNHVATQAPMQPLLHAACASESATPADVMIAGPAFSGSMSSFAAALRDAPGLVPEHPLHICLLAYSATSLSNRQIATAMSGKTQNRIDYRALTVDDSVKMARVFELGRLHGITPAEVLVFEEESVFGRNICPADVRGCEQVQILGFSANISDLRVARAVRREKTGLDGVLRLAEPLTSNLSIDAQAENGSEAPITRRSALSAASADLTLTQQLRATVPAHPRLIVIAATEVRDRVYLAERAREQFPAALLVDLASDLVMSHPDYVHATRGMIMLGSVPITGYVRQNRMLQDGPPTGGPVVVADRVAVTDDQAVLRNLICDAELAGSGLVAARTADHRCVLRQSGDRGAAITHVIGRLGPEYVTFPAHSGVLRERMAWLRANGHFILIGILLVSLLRTRQRRLPRNSPVTAGVRHRARSLMLAMAQRIHVGVHWLVIGVVAPLASLGALALFGWQFARGSAEYLDLVMSCAAIVLLAFTSRRAVILIVSVAGKGTQVSHLGARRWLRRWYQLIASQRIGGSHSATLWSDAGYLLLGLGVLAAGFSASRALYAQLQRCWVAGQAATRTSLDIAANSGIAVVAPFLTAVFLLVLALMSLAAVYAIWRATSRAWRVIAPVAAKHGRDAMAVGVIPSIAWTVLALLAAYAFATSIPIGITPWGLSYDLGFFLCLGGAATLSGGALLLAMTGLFRISRALEITRYALRYGGWHERWLHTPWEKYDYTGYVFPLTPATAAPECLLLVDPGDRRALTPIHLSMQVRRHLRPAGQTTPDSDVPAAAAQVRCALRELFALEIWALRQSLFLSLLASLVCAILVYAYPVPGRDGLLSLAMLVMVVASLFSSVAIVRLEREPLLSRLLCNRRGGLQLTLALITTVAMPFILLGAAILVAEVPGVREWAGGYLGPILKLLGFDV